MSEYLAKIKDAIEVMHHCKARHASTSPVTEYFEGKLAWTGEVETFDLHGHPKAKRCHAWSYEENGETQYVTVLEIPPVDSPSSAVTIAIAAKARKHSQ